jgi:hypothetical protein
MDRGANVACHLEDVHEQRTVGLSERRIATRHYALGHV